MNKNNIHRAPIRLSRISSQRAGFTLFVALVVSSMLLAVGFSLSNIILKQLIFSNSGRESQLAFYAADSGAECALFWDRKNRLGYTTYDGAFATSTSDADSLDILCGMGMATELDVATAKVGSLEKFGDGLDAATTTFFVDYRDPNNTIVHKACAKVTVAKWSDSGTGVQRTRIDSRGYNAPFEGLVGFLDAPGQDGGKCNISNNRVVERAIRLDY